jgi:hypothetical protein
VVFPRDDPDRAGRNDWFCASGRRGLGAASCLLA